MPGLDEKAIVSPITNWLERWYTVPLLAANFLAAVLVIICVKHAELGELLAGTFSPCKFLLQLISPGILKITFGKMPSSFYANVLSLSFVLSLLSGSLAVLIGFFRYRNRPARLSEFILERFGRPNGNVFLLIIILLAIFSAFLFGWVTLIFLGFYGENISPNKSLFEFWIYNFLLSAATLSTVISISPPISYFFIL